MLDVPWFPNADVQKFPSPEMALDDPDGLLAIGANLSASTLVNAYRQGIFPWYSSQPIMWWSPSVRAVIPSEKIHISKNMAKLLHQQRYTVKSDIAFYDVIRLCSSRDSTWITSEMFNAYVELYEKGVAHSVEVYNENMELVGGLYGVFVRNCFCGESMFSREANASKLALIMLARFLWAHECTLIDCQMPTKHLATMGAIECLRAEFVAELFKMNDNGLLLDTQWVDLWQHYWQ